MFTPKALENSYEPKPNGSQSEKSGLCWFKMNGRSHVSLVFALLLGLASAACDWNEFGNGPTNPHNSKSTGPVAGLPPQYNLLHPSGSTFHAGEVGVTGDAVGSTYVTSYDNWVNAYNQNGVLAGSYNLAMAGPRAAPYVATRGARRSFLFTGATGGGFHAIRVVKTTPTAYSMTLADVDMTFGPSESSPKRAQDNTFYIADRAGEVRRYQFAGGVLTLLGVLPLGQPVPGAIALYDVDPMIPGEEVLVATANGTLHVLDHNLTGILWTNNVGVATNDVYYAGVTVAERGGMAPVALLPIASASTAGMATPNSGIVRAINLQTGAVEWEIAPTGTVIGVDSAEGSVALLFEQQIQTPNGVYPVYHATFVTSAGVLYGIDLQAGTEIWRTPLVNGGYDAPVVDANNIIYVGDGSSNLYAVEGKVPMHGMVFWMDPRFAAGPNDIVKLGIHGNGGLLVGTQTSAYMFR